MTPAVLDIAVAIVMLLSMMIAWYRGLIREVFTLVGLGAAAWASWKGGHLLIPAFNGWLNVGGDGGEKAAEVVTEGMNADVASNAAMTAALHKGDLILGVISPALAAKLCAYGSVFLGVFVAVSLVSFFLSRGAQEMGLGALDKLGGAAFGLARGFLLVFLFYVPWTFLIDKDKFPAWARNSLTVPVMERALAYADDRFELTQKIEDRGNGIAIRIGKIDPAASDDEKDLRDDLTREERERRAAP